MISTTSLMVFAAVEATGTEWRKISRNADSYNHKVDNQTRIQVIKILCSRIKKEGK